ncbi:MAG: SAP domain-containing protein [Casimicrobiaceae bacterium]
MPTYKVKEGKTFGLLAAGVEVQLTEEEAKVHANKLERVADTRNDLGLVIDPAQKLFQNPAIPPTDEGTIVEEKDYSSLTVSDLRGELEKRGLSIVGNKAELIIRLQEDDKSGD